MDRYVKETNRLYGVMDKRLSANEFLGGADYSIADMASYPWVVPHERQQQNLDDFPSLKRWFQAIKARPAVIRAYEKGAAVNPANQATVNDESKKILFGQSADSLKR
jgi:GST-like protein